MAKSVQKRVREWRERKAKEGGRSLSVWLEPESNQMLDFLLQYYNETASPLIARAIRMLYEAIDIELERRRTLLPEEEKSLLGKFDLGARPIEAGYQGKDGPVFENDFSEDPLLLEIKEKLSQGAAWKDLRRTLLQEWIISMRNHGYSYEEMAEILNEVQIPTLSGHGKWEPGMLPTIQILNY